MLNSQNNKKSLEETIAELQKKYKNKLSPLSEEYQRSNSSVNYIPQPKTNQNDYRQQLLQDFKPQSRSFGMPFD